MPEPKRPLTEEEAAQIRAALPPHLQPLMDHVYTIRAHCYNCEYFSTKTAICSHWDDVVPQDARMSVKECWYRITPEPF